MSEQENAYIHFRDTGEFLTGEPIASKPMSDQDKARKLAEEILDRIVAHTISWRTLPANIAFVEKQLLQFAQERESDCAERCNCEDSWPSYSQYPKPHCPIHSVQQAAPKSEAVRELTECEKEWIGEIASEKLSGNIVRENFARGVVGGVRIALDLIAKHSKKGEVR